MAEAGILAGSEQRVMISNTYLEQNKGASGRSADINLIDLTPVSAFVNLRNVQSRGIPMTGPNSRFNPRGISINDTQDDESATYAIINGRELNDPVRNFMTERHTCGQVHPNRYRTIRPNGTTARGIILHG